MDGAGGAGHVEDIVHVQPDWINDVMANHFEALVPYQVFNIGDAAGLEIIETEYMVSLGQHGLAQMRSNESGTAGNESGFHGTDLARSGGV